MIAITQAANQLELAFAIRTSRRGIFVSKREAAAGARQLLPAEQETESAAGRLATQIEDARSTVLTRTSDDTELEACADRIERAARDLSVALRELARRRRSESEET